MASFTNGLQTQGYFTSLQQMWGPGCTEHTPGNSLCTGFDDQICCRCEDQIAQYTDLGLVKETVSSVHRLWRQIGRRCDGQTTLYTDLGVDRKTVSSVHRIWIPDLLHVMAMWYNTQLGVCEVMKHQKLQALWWEDKNTGCLKTTAQLAVSSVEATIQQLIEHTANETTYIDKKGLKHTLGHPCWKILFCHINNLGSRVLLFLKEHAKYFK